MQKLQKLPVSKASAGTGDMKPGSPAHSTRLCQKTFRLHRTGDGGGRRMQGGGTQALFREGPRRWKAEHEKRLFLPARSLGEHKGARARKQGPTFRSMSSDFLRSKFRAAKTWEGQARSRMSWSWGFSKTAQLVKARCLPLLGSKSGTNG